MEDLHPPEVLRIRKGIVDASRAVSIVQSALLSYFLYVAVDGQRGCSVSLFCLHLDSSFLSSFRQRGLLQPQSQRHRFPNRKHVDVRCFLVQKALTCVAQCRNPDVVLDKIRVLLNDILYPLPFEGPHPVTETWREIELTAPPLHFSRKYLIHSPSHYHPVPAVVQFLLGGEGETELSYPASPMYPGCQPRSDAYSGIPFHFARASVHSSLAKPYGVLQSQSDERSLG
jgi:hypothetical protein